MSFNKIIIVGNVGKEPQVKDFNGEKMAEFSVATTDTYKGEKNTIWWNCVLWGKRAEAVEQYVGKGSQVYVEGRVRNRTYTDKQGIERVWQEVMVTDIQFLSRKDGAGVPADDDLPE